MASYLLRLFEENPTNIALYDAMMNMQQSEYIQALCTLIEKHFTLTHLSEEEQLCLQCIVQDLHEYEGVGMPIIQAALQS